MTSVEGGLPVEDGDGGIRDPRTRRPIGFDDDGGRGALLEFLEQLRETLGIVNQRAEQLFDPHFAELLHPAWRQLEPRFAEVLDAVAEADTDTLERHGLLGPELELKLDVWETSRARFEAKLEAVQTPTRRRVPRFLKGINLRSVKRALGTALSHADTVIESVASALPGPAGIAAGGIAELKTVVEKVTDRGR